MADKYSVILADPPWPGYGAAHLRLGKHDHTLPRNHYATMSTSTLCAMPIAALAAKDATLFMWATNRTLPDALTIMSAWGFEYVNVAFCWVKLLKNGDIQKRGLGQYTKQQIELCLLGKRGKPAQYRKARNVAQVIATVRREHSRKPDQQYGRIMRLFDGPYLELFARQQWPGWDVWGNQTNLFPAQPFLFDEGMAA